MFFLLILEGVVAERLMRLSWKQWWKHSRVQFPSTSFLFLLKFNSIFIYIPLLYILFGVYFTSDGIRTRALYLEGRRSNQLTYRRFLLFILSLLVSGRNRTPIFQSEAECTAIMLQTHANAGIEPALIKVKV